jgi:hypothetical protein
MGKDDFPSNQAENWFLQGEEKFTIGDFEGAIFCYDKAIEIKPDYHKACIGDKLRKRGNCQG